MECLNRDTLEYQMLKEASGLPEFKLDSFLRYYISKYEKYPELDEIPGANSSEAILKFLQVRHHNKIQYTELENVLKFTGEQTLEKAIQNINNKYKDVIFKAVELNGKAIIQIERRPSEYYWKSRKSIKSPLIQSRAIIVSRLNSLKELYGINIKEITNADLQSDEWKGKLPNSETTNGFIYEGDIYINTDSVDVSTTKIHELLHLFLGSLKFTNPKLYLQLVSLISDNPKIEKLGEGYKGRTQNDVLEEIFVREYSKLLTGQDSLLFDLDFKQQKEINTHILRTLDSFLEGNFSVKSLQLSEIMTSTIQTLINDTDSDIATPYLPLLSNISRKIANTKQDLINKKQLKQECE